MRSARLGFCEKDCEDIHNGCVIYFMKVIRLSPNIPTRYNTNIS